MKYIHIILNYAFVKIQDKNLKLHQRQKAENTVKMWPTSEP